VGSVSLPWPDTTVLCAGGADGHKNHCNPTPDTRRLTSSPDRRLGSCYGGVMTLKSLMLFLFKASVVGLAAAFIAVFLNPELLGARRPVVQIREVVAASPSPQQASAPVDSYAEAVRYAAPAVANIFTTKVVVRRTAPAYEDPLLHYFFGRQRTPAVQRELETSLGSGVLVSPDGYLLTNNHVIADADEILVLLADDRRLVASVVGTDPETDLAVLRVRGEDDLPAMHVNLATSPEVGDVALAIGNPYGVGQTVTMGIISATGRDHLGINTFENFIQTDAAINPGNSGGALINARGDLIGINTAIFSKSGGSQGIGFAIPARLAVNVMEQIIEHGHPVRGWLGIEARSLDSNHTSSFGLVDQRGVVVAGVYRDSPAAKAGLAAGDVITHIDSEVAENARVVLKRIAKYPPGSSIRIRGYRGREPFEFAAVVAQRPVQQF